MRISSVVDWKHRVRQAIVGPASAAMVIAVGLAPASAGNASAALLVVLYQFQNNRDGWAPNSPPTLGKDGALFGMTAMGGVAACQQVVGCGTVYKLTPPGTSGAPWTQTVLHRFRGGLDGIANQGSTNYPNNALTLGEDGALFGTTMIGGGNGCGGTGCGTAFELTPPASAGGLWTETILHRFHGGRDGAVPTSALVAGADGAHYGVTSFGGDPSCGLGGYPITGCGTVFKLSPPADPGGAWTETILYREPSLAGWYPASDLTPFRGALYGTTYGAGTTNCGTVFELVPPVKAAGGWHHRILYSFPANCQNRRNPGSFPGGGLVVAQGVIYGTTTVGGGSGSSQGAGGTAFALTRPAKPGAQWDIETLHDFNVPPRKDGFGPVGDLVAGKGGVLFGATGQGGDGPCSGGCGTVWQLTPPTSPGGAWREKILHRFQNGGDGAGPTGVNAGPNGVLYGTTVGGGGGDEFCKGFGGCGTVFEIRP